MGGRNAGKELMDTVTAKQNGGRGQGGKGEGEGWERGQETRAG